MRVKLLAAFAVAVLLTAGLASRASPETRSKAYSELKRAWSRDWPFSRGRSIPNRLRPLFEPIVPVRIELEPGVSLMLDPQDLVARELFERGAWESGSWAEIERALPVGGVFVDVGAHIGYHALKAAKHVGPNGTVVAIEPNPSTVEQLLANVEASSAAINVVPEACADSEGEITLFAAGRANTGMSSMAQETAGRDGPIAGAHKVRARPLDAILAEAGVDRVDVLKIDVEGAELMVLQGAVKTLGGSAPFLVVEMIDTQLQAMGASEEQVHQFLRAAGYRFLSRTSLNAFFAKQ